MYQDRQVARSLIHYDHLAITELFTPHSVIRVLGVTLPGVLRSQEPAPHSNLSLGARTCKKVLIASLSFLMSLVTRRKIDFRPSTARDFLKR